MKPGDRVINSIGEHGTVVFVAPENDHFEFIGKSKMVPVHVDGMPDDEYFLHHPEKLREAFRSVDQCPECGAPLLDAAGGGVKCSKCRWWFCY